jgi:thiol-disulfide isomerase/thioredoxin
MRRWRYGLLILLGLAMLAAGRLWMRHGSPSEVAPPDDPDAPSGSTILDAATEAAEETSRLFVLAINGGGSPGQNFKSHLLHLQGMVDLLHTAGISDERITVLSGDGADPTPDLVERTADLGPDDWRLYGTDLEDHFSHVAFLGNSAVTGARLYPATRGALSIWMMTVGQQLRAGDTLLLYVTDHGTLGTDPDGNRIVLWGPDASWSVRQLRDSLETLDPGVRVVALMSQCYSGGFAKLASLGGSGEPTGRFCGFFSTTAQQKAYGCYPETRDNPKVGHSFAFLQALPAAAGRLSVAHELAQEFDDTPDIPLRTSELYLGDLLTEAARTRKLRLASFVDDLLQATWTNTPALNLQAQRLDRLSDRFGLPTIRSRAELANTAVAIQEALAQLGPLSVALGKSLAETNREELRRFLDMRSDLKIALDPAALKAMDLERRVRLAKSFLYDLATYAGRRMPPVKLDRDALTRMTFRMRVRMAAIARIQAVLDAIAGERFLADFPAQRASLQKLLDCESLELKLPGTQWVPPGPALPSLHQDLLQLKNLAARDAIDGVVKQQAASLGEQAPELQLVPYRGENPPSGKPLLLFFWATWCKACKHVVPSLLTWAQRQNVTVLAITDEDAPALDQFFVVRQPFPLLIARDPEQRTMSHFGVRSLPSFALLDRQGKLVSPVTNSLRDLPTETAE